MPDPNSLLARLAFALGLAPEAGEDAVIAAVEELADKAKGDAKPDPRQYAPVAAMAELLRDRNKRLAVMAEQEKVEDAFRKG